MREGLMQPPAGAQQQQLTQAPEGEGLEGGPDSYFGGDQQATPEEQAMYDKAMDAIWGLIYSEEKTVNDMVDAMSNANGDPAQLGVIAGDLALPLMEMIDTDMESKGATMPESVRLEVGIGLIEEVLEIAETAEILPTDEDSIGVAIAAAQDTMMSKYGRHMSERGMISPEAGQNMLHEMRGVASDHMGIPEKMLHPEQQGEQGGPPQGGPPQGGPPQGGPGGLMRRGGPA